MKWDKKYESWYKFFIIIGIIGNFYAFVLLFRGFGFFNFISNSLMWSGMILINVYLIAKTRMNSIK